mmetsp:Transcript_19536/g.54280  ORF Transcript_19536/g.54280 Transcript_19536/m.54280 type:complete len:209 (-) Transcript_19536:55-681(-)
MLLHSIVRCHVLQEAPHRALNAARPNRKDIAVELDRFTIVAHGVGEWIHDLKRTSTSIGQGFGIGEAGIQAHGGQRAQIVVGAVQLGFGMRHAILVGLHLVSWQRRLRIHRLCGSMRWYAVRWYALMCGVVNCGSMVVGVVVDGVGLMLLRAFFFSHFLLVGSSNVANGYIVVVLIMSGLKTVVLGASRNGTKKHTQTCFSQRKTTQP